VNLYIFAKIGEYAICIFDLDCNVDYRGLSRYTESVTGWGPLFTIAPRHIYNYLDANVKHYHI